MPTLKLKQNDAAIAAYGKAATLDPHPATAYFNLCATMYNVGKTASGGGRSLRQGDRRGSEQG